MSKFGARELNKDRSYASTLIEWARHGQAPIDHFQVFGERRSGTNFLDRLLDDNLTIRSATNYGWKHGFPAMPCILSSALIVVVVREPFSWLGSLHNRPFIDSLDGLGFSDFLRSELHGKYKPWSFGHGKWGYSGMPRKARTSSQFERHPISGEPIRNPLELRKLKNTAFLSFLKRGCNSVFIDYDTANQKPLEVVEAISEVFDIKLSRELKRPDRVGPAGTDRGRVLLDDIGSEDLAFILSNLDDSLENRLGYTSIIQNARRLATQADGHSKFNTLI